MRVTIIGAGPAGLFCANELAGHCEVEILEQGQQQAYRKCPERCQKCPTAAQGMCHVLHGEGGAGGFSDGKVAFSADRGVQEEGHVLREDQFAPRAEKLSAILYGLNPGRRVIPAIDRPTFLHGSQFRFSSYPLWHYGNDGIQKVVHNLVEQLRKKGVVIRYSSHRTVPTLELDLLEKGSEVVVASGSYNTAWSESLARRLGVRLVDGPAGIGIRLETKSLYLRPLMDKFYDFKLHLAHKGTDYRSFCVNGAGTVVNCSHYVYPERRIVTLNGRAIGEDSRDRANLAILAKITGTGAKYTVRHLAETLNARGYALPLTQRTEDFMAPVARPTKQDTLPFLTNTDVAFGRLQELWPEWLVEGFRAYLAELEKILPESVRSPESTIYAPEIKYHGLVWPLTKGFGVEGVPGLHMVGSATGLTDSFTTAAMTGMSCGEHILKRRATNG